MKRFIILLLILVAGSQVKAQKQKVWIDSDTGNEMDDLYAIVRLVKAPSIDLIGLSSAHFNNPDLLVFEKWNAYSTKGLNTVAESQRLNEQILKALGRLDIIHPMGADRQIGRSWGEQDPRNSPAAQASMKVKTTGRARTNVPRWRPRESTRRPTRRTRRAGRAGEKTRW